MLTIDEALAKIVEEVGPLPPERMALDDAYGLVLAEAVVSDIDSPPFDKSLMDGFAVCASDVGDGTARLRLIEEVTAGRVAVRPVRPGEATQLMTGAPLPDGADAVVRVEDARIEEAPDGSHWVTIATSRVAAGANVIRRGTSLRRGECVLPAGRLLRPQELGALAEMGQHTVCVRRRPRIGVLATGDELVPVEATPGPGQIRNSNEIMLVAQIRRAGGQPVPLGIARDRRDHLRERIQAGLDCDVLLLSGGVSAGKLDLVPSELEAAGVRAVFHKVNIKPGKPLWFGLHPAGCRVFGLPGNPVSSMVCFELFVRTAIRCLMGIQPARPTPVQARLTKEHAARGERPTYFPARCEWDGSQAVVTPVAWHGSSDLQATVNANSMAVFPAGDRTYRAGETIEVIRWDAI